MTGVETQSAETMGWIRTGSGAKQLHSVAAGLDVHRAFAEPVERKINVNTTEHATSSSTINETYSILSRKIKDHDLPFINADEVRKHDGKDGNRLCTYQDSKLRTTAAAVLMHCR